MTASVVLRQEAQEVTMQRAIIAALLAVASARLAHAAQPQPGIEQHGPNAVVVSPADLKAGNLAIIPACMKLVAVNGDPFQGPAMLYLTGEAGCVIPWHWHTANEQLVMVGGEARVEMKDGGNEAVKPGSYAFLASKHVHRFTCTSACALYDYSDAKFDIHYVDQNGTEIPPARAYEAAGMQAPAADEGTKGH